jgi:23S rRNA (cytosine1962-C5)-methyltransferase
MRLRRDVLGLGAQASPALPFAETPLAEAALSALAPKERELLAALDAQIGKIETFAAQYGMNAMEETADLRRSREALVMKVPALSETAPLPRATCPVTGGQTTAYRLINSEGDGLGGLTVDVYGDYLSVQIGTAGMDTRKETFLTILEDRLHPKGILDRSDSRMRELEKLGPPSAAPLRGEAPAEPFFLSEHGVEMVCDLRPGHGQKTGLYLDQRENRRRFAGFAAGRNVLDVFCYSGGFALHAARAGARSITLVDSSADGLELARQNLVRNKIDDADLVEAGWNEGFKHLREAGRRFDLIVLDPPKFARAKEQVSQALSAYRDLNAQAARLLAPGGILFTCSCSGNVSEVEFERTVASAMRQAERRAVLLERRGAAPDHPVPPGFEQGRYLKCLVLQVV